MMDNNTSKHPPPAQGLVTDDLVQARPEDFGYSRFQLRVWHGMTFGAWMRLLKGNLGKVSFGRYGLLVSVTVFSIGNSILKGVSKLLYDRRVQATEIKPDPLFILGHWRSGTTWLNQLLGYDENHASATAVQCFTPDTFLVLRGILNGAALPKKRPMDNVALTTTSAEEDEFAILLSGASTPYRNMAFPCHSLDGAEVATDDMSEETAQFWRHAWIGFLKKIQFCNPGKRLVLKSPAHTLRIAEILRQFPNAKFVHIVRDPYKIILSSIKSNQAMAATQCLQTKMPSAKASQAITLQDFAQFHDAYDACKDMIPQENLLTIHYEDLRENTMDTVSRIYSKLDLGGAKAAKNLTAYVDEKKGYVNNQYDLPDEIEELVYSTCRRYFDQYGYKRMSKRKNETK